MAERKLSFAVFGNASKAFDSHQITEILGYLGAHELMYILNRTFIIAYKRSLRNRFL